MNGYVFVFLTGILTTVGAEVFAILAVVGVTAYKEYKSDKRKDD